VEVGEAIAGFEPESIAANMALVGDNGLASSLPMLTANDRFSSGRLAPIVLARNTPRAVAGVGNDDEDGNAVDTVAAVIVAGIGGARCDRSDAVVVSAVESSTGGDKSGMGETVGGAEAGGRAGERDILLGAAVVVMMDGGTITGTSTGRFDSGRLVLPAIARLSVTAPTEGVE